jgi:hypothetical protein
MSSTAKRGKKVAFVRKKKVGDYEYYQVVRSVRVDGKPRQKVLLHLNGHPSVEDALEEWPREIKRLRRRAQRDRAMVPEGSESVPVFRDLLKRAVGFEKRAHDLESNLKKLRELKKQGVV